ncbi:hypothetical protein [Vibrio parahaemolyticus]|uniref:hypothetical protein n=1 Tax=Vibrio parahaemolyticus TaxID=670 RepID=UPI0010D2333B|nr:hypothetical protein [Vibrio parahaemolyticus]EJC6860299.1 hypothetical protein [Vibrio parahaemolyticus]ELB2157786.1 hypothetical protein [Vibrio parahaemolyticus]MDF4309655.1 hypothetical protein [Vibrio parahaemolyticus]MDF4642686.1 hypothetical protein [Vibrio parahaemolyticus]MDF5073428.1 hypothetical protein [Vibrio parahaemolyticus]
MNWVSEIFKDITVSKTLTGACFITGISLLFAPAFFPDTLEALPKGWATGTLGVVVFSGSLLMFWGLRVVKEGIVSFITTKTQNSLSQSLTDFELSFIFELGKLADKTADLDNINYNSVSFSKLELLDVCRTLKEKGLLDVNCFDENLVSLTENGRKKALELHKAQALKN